MTGSIARVCLAASAAAIACGFALRARAHIDMTSPEMDSGGQKLSPCGGLVATPSFDVFQPGETIVVEWNETINHPGHFRISFDDAGDDDFYQMIDENDMPPSEPSILLDGIPDEPDGQYAVQVTLPNVTCDDCTLQLIQVMYDKLGNGFQWGVDVSDVYFRCAKLRLEPGGSTTASSGAGGGPVAAGAGGAGTVGAGGSTVAAGGSTSDGTTGSSDDGGCACSLPRSGSFPRGLALVATGALVLAARRARRHGVGATP